ncbi:MULTISPECIES: peroxiredoxin [Candidatus Ichthyocystis]|uniref:thioredoxin-dependent peroxiredoxin n=1 Tax=Candidatus Ichthyocystis hellenicum TaxID=1561003 RepID=A0A0S4M1Q5_9BURK|nr:peroxiredoxin [Candidatus Ichthyocystis hellenicum]
MKVGQKVPNFSAMSHTGDLCHLSEFIDKPLVLYFYPRDNTPGCTQEACDFRDCWGKKWQQRCYLLGVSRDSVSSHNKFIDKYSLPFTLISDSDEVLCDLFSVMKEKNMYGKKVRGIERSTFIIDTKYILVREWRKVKVEGHAEEVLSAVRDLT